MKFVVAFLIVVVWPGATAWALSVTPPRGGDAGVDLAYDPHWWNRTPPAPTVGEKAARRVTATSTTTRVVPRRTVVPRPPVPRSTAGVSGTCSEWLAAAHVDDVGSAIGLINRESGCNPYSRNRYSGACGVAQELPCGKSGCVLGDGACQVAWMDRYVHGRYGTWARALSFQINNGWY